MGYALASSGDDPALVTVAVECGLPIKEFTGELAGGSRQGLTEAPSAAPEPEPESVNNWAPVPAAARGQTDPATPRSSLFAAPPGSAEAAPAAPPPAAPPPAPLESMEQMEQTAESADERAARYIAAGDPRAAQAALVAAREFLAAGHMHAASDLLLQVIASGLADHQAQRLLVDVATSIGKKDVARAKCALLAEALRLDGQAELAVEVERLAQAV